MDDTLNKKNSINHLKSYFLIELLIIIQSIYSLFLLQILSGGNTSFKAKYILLNIIIIYYVHKILFLIINRIYVSASIVHIFCIILGAANHYIYEFRGDMVSPWDLLSLGTAANVAGGYEYKLHLPLIYLSLTTIVDIVFLFLVRNKIKAQEKRIAYAMVSIFAGVLIWGVCIRTYAYKSLTPRDSMINLSRPYSEKGVALSLYNIFNNFTVTLPDGYSQEACKDVVGEILSDDLSGDDNVVVPDNIIVIMNESFTDFHNLNGISQIDDSLSFFNSLSENTIRGNLYVPVFGGKTTNSEYEFLTGFSMAHQKGSPLSMMGTIKRPSIVDFMKGNGYTTLGMHMASGNNYHRDKVYESLGFDETLFLDDVNSPLTIHNHATDEWNYEELIEYYEKHNTEKLFVFNVTMQNHGGYDFDFEKETKRRTVDLSSYGSFREAENYLSLLNMSDEAFEELISYFENVDKNTMICMFGDHMPKVESGFFDIIEQDMDMDDPSVYINENVTPFVIWTNYDMPSDYIEGISANYLGELILEKAGLELTPFYKIEKNMREKYPVYSQNGIIDKDGHFYSLADEIEGDIDVKGYQYLEYNGANEPKAGILWDAFQ